MDQRMLYEVIRLERERELVAALRRAEIERGRRQQHESAARPAASTSLAGRLRLRWPRFLVAR